MTKFLDLSAPIPFDTHAASGHTPEAITSRNPVLSPTMLSTQRTSLLPLPHLRQWSTALHSSSNSSAAALQPLRTRRRISPAPASPAVHIVAMESGEPVHLEEGSNSGKGSHQGEPSKPTPSSSMSAREETLLELVGRRVPVGSCKLDGWRVWWSFVRGGRWRERGKWPGRVWGCQTRARTR